MVTVAVRLTSTSCDHYLYVLKVNDAKDLIVELDGLNSEFQQGYIDDWDIAFEEDTRPNLFNIGNWKMAIIENLTIKREILDEEWKELNG